MNISERAVRIVVSDVVTGFRHHYFNLSQCSDYTKEYLKADAKLDGIALLFPDGKINRFIMNYKQELYQLHQLCKFAKKVA